MNGPAKYFAWNMATVSMFTLLVSFGKSCTFFEFESQTDTIRKRRNLPRFDRIHMIPLLPSLLGFTGPTDRSKRELFTRELQNGRDPGPSCSAVWITGEGREGGEVGRVISLGGRVSNFLFFLLHTWWVSVKRSFFLSIPEYSFNRK